MEEGTIVLISPNLLPFDVISKIIWVYYRHVTKSHNISIFYTKSHQSLEDPTPTPIIMCSEAKIGLLFPLLSYLIRSLQPKSFQTPPFPTGNIPKARKGIIMDDEQYWWYQAQ
jgi:hypothetical protein